MCLLVYSFSLRKKIKYLNGENMKKAKNSLLIITGILIIVFLTSCKSCRLLEKKYEITYFEYFDTVTSIIGYETSKKNFTNNANLIKEKLKEYHELYDIYHEYEGLNNLCTVNKKASISPVKVDQKIIELLLFAKEIYILTNKMVNVSMGSILKLWHEAREYATQYPTDSYLPNYEDLLEAKKHIDFDKVIIDEKNQTIYFEDDQIQLDVGALAKGYATEQIAKMLKKDNISSYVLDVGGNIRIIGSKNNNKPWTVGIKNPNQNSDNTNIQVVQVQDKAVVTSGSYQRYFTVDGKNYHHIINPNTMYPENNFVSVTIITNNSGLADGLSTGLFNMSLEEGKKLINRIENTEAMWIDTNFNIYYSDHFLDYNS